MEQIWAYMFLLIDCIAGLKNPRRAVALLVSLSLFLGTSANASMMLHDISIDHTETHHSSPSSADHSVSTSTGVTHDVHDSKTSKHAAHHSTPAHSGCCSEADNDCAHSALACSVHCAVSIPVTTTGQVANFFTSYLLAPLAPSTLPLPDLSIPFKPPRV